MKRSTQVKNNYGKMQMLQFGKNTNKAAVGLFDWKQLGTTGPHMIKPKRAQNK